MFRGIRSSPSNPPQRKVRTVEVFDPLALVAQHFGVGGAEGIVLQVLDGFLIGSLSRRPPIIEAWRGIVCNWEVLLCRTLVPVNFYQTHVPVYKCDVTWSQVLSLSGRFVPREPVPRWDFVKADGPGWLPDLL